MRKIYSISTLLLFVTLLLGCAGKPADTKRPEEENKNPSTTKIEPAQPSGETPLEGPLVIDPNKTPKKMTISGSLPQPTETETANKINRLLEEHNTVRPGIKYPAARTPTNTKSITISNPTTPSTTKSTSSQEDAYTIVQVFYGTDRERTDGIASHPLGRIPWTLLAMASGAVTLFVILLCCFWIRGKKAVLLPLVLILITGGLGAAATLIPTNTKPKEARTDIAYSGDRGTLDMGICEVSIPKTHQLAELESPSILRFEISEDPTKHVVLLGIDPLDQENFIAQLRNRVKESDDQEAFVFVHGYNVNFEDAARRTAQLAYDLNFQGAPILYSWPSQGGLFKYTIDENNVEWTVAHLKQFLQLIAKQSNAKRVHLIAHSMGNRALTRALEKLSYTDARNG
ncbi:MAG: alpha/beta hydrolase, partial [Planctomycetia bacterium]